jgi:hypothetical protein
MILLGRFRMIPRGEERGRVVGREQRGIGRGSKDGKGWLPSIDIGESGDTHIGAAYLNLENVLGECHEIRVSIIGALANAHHGVRVGEYGCKIDDIVEAAVESLEPLLSLFARVGAGDDGDGNMLIVIALAGDLRGISRAEPNAARE